MDFFKIFVNKLISLEGLDVVFLFRHLPTYVFHIQFAVYD